MIQFHSEAPLNPDCEEIARRRSRLGSGETPMAYLFSRVGADMKSRLEITGGWGNSVLYLGFHEAFSGFPGVPCQWISPLEGDSWSDIKPGYDTVIFNLQLAWLDHEYWFNLVRSLLKPEGRFYFSSLGPDTLHELAEAWHGVDRFPHVHSFVDIHHLGDALMQAGFSQPVLDADWMGVEYEDVELLMEDLRREGFHNVHPERRRTLTARGRLEAVKQRMETQSPVRATFELLFGFATVPKSRVTAEKVMVNPPMR